jgi:hypothetical protein
MNYTGYAAVIDLGGAHAIALGDGILCRKLFTHHGGLAKDFLTRYPGTEWVKDYASILDDDSIGLVLITGGSPDSLAMAGAALRIGKLVRVI